ncbi:MAG: PP2C family serine/threonine-protein phosphatase [Pirellulaceae bacterium]
MTNSLVKWDALLQVATISDIGMRRTNNQDNFFVSLASTMDQWQRRGHLFIVADGMGAHAAGELASKIAVDHIPHLYAKFGGSPAAEALRKAIGDANAEIHKRGQVNEEFHNMGTTCSSMLLMPDGAYCGHVGDSRVYRLRGSRIDQLTFDHSLVWEMKAAGQVTGKDELDKIPKNVITRSLGPYPEIKVDIEGPFPVELGDTFLLCSDGLTGQVSDEEIGVILATLEPVAAAQLLVDIANLRGGPDNITIIIVKVIAPQLVTSQATGVRKMTSHKGNKPGVHLLSWMALLISVVLTVLFYMTQSLQGAIIPGAIALVSFVWVLVQLIQSLNASSSTTSPVMRYGKGPYTTHDCKPDGWQLVGNLKEMISQMQLAGQSGGWKIDVDSLTNLLNDAEESDSKKDLKGAIRGFGAVVSFIMEQLRNNGSSNGIEPTE